MGMRQRRYAQERDSAGTLASRSHVASPQAGSLLRRARAHLAVVRALPDVDFAGFPTNMVMSPIVAALAFPYARVLPRINGAGH
jgi:hypothetical protein